MHDSFEAEPEEAITICGVTRRFGTRVALDDVSLTVSKGCVLGLVGENGAGKTTLIKHILGLLKPQVGSVRVFGRDPVTDPVGVLSQIGYLSEEGDLPDWMRVDELLRYAQSFYTTWDADYAESLCREFGLDPRAKLRHLSKGQRARAGLTMALAYRPALLLLDEPSSGLDPIVRRDILGAILRTVAEEGRTVLFSSHLLGEVERISDRIAMIRSGRIVFCDTLEQIMESHFRMTFQFESPRRTPPSLDGALTWEGDGREWTTICSGRSEQLEAAAAVLHARIVDQALPSLDEIFMAQAGAGRNSER